MSHPPIPTPARRDAAPDEPISLVVHTMPDPTDVGAAQPTRGARLKLLAILIICSLPVLVSYIGFFVIKPTGKAAYGELMVPAMAMPGVQVFEAGDGRPSDLAALRGQWLLVTVRGGSCDAGCQRHLFLQRQLREMLSKEKDRVDWVWLIDDGAQPDVQHATWMRQNGAVVLRGEAKALHAWLPPGAGKTSADYVYVVDPLGNAMMRFAMPFDATQAAKAKRDLDRLLQASASWDKAGR